MRIFVLLDKPADAGPVLTELSDHMRDGDILHLATDMHAAVRIFRPPYDVTYAEQALSIPFLVDRVARRR
jgi:hypothetical protein